MFVFSVEDTSIWAFLSQQPSLRALPQQSLLMLFLNQSQPSCYLVRLESLFLTDTWRGTLPSTVDILRHQAEECPLCQVQSNIPEWSSELIIEHRQNWLSDISSGQKMTLVWNIQPQFRRYNLNWNKPWQCPNQCFTSLENDEEILVYHVCDIVFISGTKEFKIHP